MALCFIEPHDAIRVIAESIGRQARRQLLGELVRAWVDAIPELPRTDNGLEQLFGWQRCHERRATGRKMASPATLLRGEVRVIAATATRLHPPAARELGRVDRHRWRDLRRRLEPRRQARTLRTRFRRDPEAYLAELEQKACQPVLPA